MKKNKFGLLLKFALSASLVIILTSGLLSIFLIQIEKLRAEAELKNKGLSLARNLAYNSEYGILSENIDDLSRLIKGLMEEQDVVYVQLLDNKGEILARDKKAGIKEAFNIEVTVKSVGLERAAEEIGLTPLRLAGERGKEKIIGNAKIGISLTRVREIVNQLLWIVWSITTSVIAIGILSIFLLTKYLLTNPLRKLLDGTQRIARGDLKSKIGIESKDEIGDLALSFNNMTVELEKAQAKLSGYAKDLEKKATERTQELRASVNDLKITTSELQEAKTSLEKRVAERTVELEKAKSNLEQKINERTADLEDSRKAILHMMKDLKEDMVKLQAVDRLKTEFLSMVSHELRTPITPIKGYLTMLLSGKMGQLAPAQQHALNVLNHQSEHLEDLIDSLLDISRLELGKPLPAQMEPLSMKKVIKEVAESIEIAVKDRGHSFTLEILGTLPTILGDKIKLKRAMTNLVGNAIKFSANGSKIMIRAMVEGANLRVEVVDNGIGIKREYLGKIFEKFFQVDSSFTRASGGIGMGLAIAKELIEIHSGKIWAESDGLGKGSKLIFTLPIVKKGVK